ncbi:MAG: DUF1634 domain-containing protein [bacterium]|nr:DUF1634 domain-containing protein [bacterium]
MTSDDRFEQLLGTLLRGGVLLAGAVTLAGMVLRLLGDHGVPVEDATFHGEPAGLRQVGSVVAGALAGRAEAIVQLGVLLLVATPIARVAASVVTFALQRDRLYVGVTLVVLAALTWGLLSG